MLRVIVLFVIFFGFVFFNTGVSFAGPQDWLKDAYTKSHQPGDGEPYSLDAEAKDLFDTNVDGVETTENVGKKIFNGQSDSIGKDDVVNSDSIFVRITRYLAKIAVILAVPVLLYVAIKIALAFGDEGKMKEAVKQIGYVVGGLLLILLSVMVIYLIISLTRKNSGIF